MAREIADAKDVLEAQKFTLGTGTPEPQGFTVGATNLATTAATATIALADLDTLTDCLPERFQPNAVLVANRKFYSKLRQLSRTSGVNDEWPNVASGKRSDRASHRYAASKVGRPVSSATSITALCWAGARSCSSTRWRIASSTLHKPSTEAGGMRPLCTPLLMRLLHSHCQRLGAWGSTSSRRIRV